MPISGRNLVTSTTGDRLGVSLCRELTFSTKKTVNAFTESARRLRRRKPCSVGRKNFSFGRRWHLGKKIERLASTLPSTGNSPSFRISLDFTSRSPAMFHSDSGPSTLVVRSDTWDVHRLNRGHRVRPQYGTGAAIAATPRKRNTMRTTMIEHEMGIRSISITRY